MWYNHYAVGVATICVCGHYVQSHYYVITLWNRIVTTYDVGQDDKKKYNIYSHLVKHITTLQSTST